MGMIVPRRFNGTTSIISYAANKSQDLTAQTLFVQCKIVGAGESPSAGGYLFSTLNGSNRNGIILRYRSDTGNVTFLADSATANTPTRTATLLYTQGNVQNMLVTWDGTINGANIHFYASENATPLVLSDGSAASGTGSVAVSGGTVDIGNRKSDTARTGNADIYRIVRWDRVLSETEFLKPSPFDPGSVRAGVALDWHDGRDWGPYHLTCPTITALDYGVTSPFVAPTRKRRPRYFFGPGAAAGFATGQYFDPLLDRRAWF